MTLYYLEPSAWVKRYCREPGSAWLAQFLAHTPNLACSSMGIIEVTAALARKAKAVETDQGAFRANLQQAEDDWTGLLSLDMTSEVVERAREVARDRALRAGDAIHLATALLLRKDFAEPGDQLTLMTSDHELLTAAAAEGISVIDPQEAERTGAAPPEIA